MYKRQAFLHWIRDGRSGLDAARRHHLEKGAAALARYTRDSRFLRLPAIGDAAQRQLPDMIAQYERTVRAWQTLTERWFF